MDDEGTRDLDEREVAFGIAIPANQKAAELVVPRIGTLYHPSARLAAASPGERRFAPAAKVQLDSPFPNSGFAVRVVVPFVETQVSRSAGTARTMNRDRVQRVAKHPLVVDVGRRQYDRKREPRRVGQNVAFCPEFPAIGRIGTSEVPPFGAFTVALSIEHQLRSSPTLAS